MSIESCREVLGGSLSAVEDAVMVLQNAVDVDMSEEAWQYALAAVSDLIIACEDLDQEVREYWRAKEARGRLTPAQRRALEAVRDGQVRFSRINMRHWTRSLKPRPRENTLMLLAERGLTAPGEYDRFLPSSSSVVVLTDAGRRALEARDG